MAASVGYATVNILPSAKGFSAAISGEMNRSLPSAGAQAGKATGASVLSAFKSMVGPAMLLAGSAAIGDFVKGTISASSNLQQSTGAIEAVFKGAAPAMSAFANDAARSFGLAKNQVNELGTVLGAQLKNAGVSMDQLAPQTQNLIGIGADLAAMFGGTTKDAVEAISSALKGERDPIERYGVSLTQASINAKAAALGFESVGGALSTEATAAATTALIMEQTADAHGAAARESDTLASRQQQLAAGWENIRASIGNAFLPVAASAVGVLANIANGIGPVLDLLRTGDFKADIFASMGLTEDSPAVGFILSLREAITAMAPTFGELGTALAGLLPSITPLGLAFQVLAPVLPQIGALLTQIATVVGSSLTVVLTALTPLIQTLTGILSGVLAMVLPIIANLFAQLAPVLGQVAALVGQVVTALAPLIAALLGTLIPVIQALMPLVQTVFGFIVSIITVAINIVSGIITAVMQALSGDWSGSWATIGATLQAAWDGILAAVGTAIDGLVQWFVGLLPAILETLAGIGEWLVDTGRQLIDGLFNGVKALWENVSAWFRDLPNVVGGFLVDAGKWLWDAGKNIVQGLIDGIGSMMGSIGRAILDLVPGPIRGVFEDALGIHSPSRVFRGYGANIGEGLIGGISAMGPGVAKATLGLATAATDAFDGTTLAVPVSIRTALDGDASIAAAIAQGNGGPIGARLATTEPATRATRAAGTEVIQLVVDGRVLSESVRKHGNSYSYRKGM